MSVQSFALTSPSLTDMSDPINLAEARARFCAAELQGDIALADWAKAYAVSLLDVAEDAPSEKTISEDIREAEKERDDLHRAEIQELLDEAAPAFDAVTNLQRAVVDALNDASSDLKSLRNLRNKLVAMTEQTGAAA